jgi:hypothetical protein
MIVLLRALATKHARATVAAWSTDRARGGGRETCWSRRWRRRGNRTRPPEHGLLICCLVCACLVVLDGEACDSVNVFSARKRFARAVKPTLCIQLYLLGWQERATCPGGGRRAASGQHQRRA